MSAESHTSLTRPNRLSWGANLPSLTSIIAYIFIIWLLYAFVSGISLRFYASVLFFFYAYIKRMWIAVVCLGIFQTLLLIPFRIIKVRHSQHIKEFVDTISKIKDTKVQREQYRDQIKLGRRSGLFYSVDFFVQLVSYTSIGRLFLTDFYNKPLNQELLYSFVPYPDYPIKDRFFKIPYPYFTQTIDIGFNTVLIAWAVIFGLLVLLRFARYYANRVKVTQPDSQRVSAAFARFSGQVLLLFILSYVLIRNFPVGWKLGIFTGDVSIPNPTFNAITAIVTFSVLVWFGINNMYRKSGLAREKGIPENVINQTERDMFKNMIFSSGLIGLGAYFITNQIPSAFELSIFTLEIISLLAPLTLDKLITTTVPVEDLELVPPNLEPEKVPDQA